MGGRPPWPAGSISRRASSGACSRVWSVCGERRVAAVVGGHDQQIVARPARQPARQRGVDRAQRAVEAVDVLAVAVDLVGLDQVGEHEPSSSSPISRSTLAIACALVGAGVRLAEADAREQVGDLADAVHRERRRSSSASR